MQLPTSSLLLAFAFLGLSCATQASTSHSAREPAFRYQGRIDSTDAAAPVIIWQGSRIEVDFEGTQLAFHFGPVDGVSFFDATVDGRTVSIEAASKQSVAFPQELSEGRHSLTLVKRSEASAGHAAFRGLGLAPGAEVFAPAERDCTARLLFFGDSITAGACNEDIGEDQWEDRITHNASMSYAALTAKRLAADYRNVSVSGMGISVGYQPLTFPETWNALFPSADSPRADLNSYQPNIVFINLGENDDSFTSNQGSDFPEDYAARYVTMVREIRAAYPQAKIALLRGGMYGGARSERLAEPLRQIVKSLEAEDPAVHHFVFEHWSRAHPRVSDHQIMAAELSAWIINNHLLPATSK